MSAQAFCEMYAAIAQEVYDALRKAHTLDASASESIAALVLSKTAQQLTIARPPPVEESLPTSPDPHEGILEVGDEVDF